MGVDCNNIRILFDDGSNKNYSMPYGNGIDQALVYRAGINLLGKLARLGKDAGNPCTDLRHFNGNHATGRGRHAGPKAIRIIARWVGPYDSEPLVFT